MKPEPLTKEKIRTHLEQDEEGRWVIHISGIRTIDVKSAVQWLLEEIEKTYKEIAGKENRMILMHIWEANLVPKIICAEKFLLPLPVEKRKSFCTDIVWTLGRASQLAILEWVKQKIRKAFEGVME